MIGTQCEKCRMWGYVFWNDEEGYLCFEHMGWLIRKPKGNEDKGFISSYAKGYKCRNYICGRSKNDKSKICKKSKPRNGNL